MNEQDVNLDRCTKRWNLKHPLNISVILLMISLGTSGSPKRYDKTLTEDLVKACFNKDVKNVKALLERNANPNALDGEGNPVAISILLRMQFSFNEFASGKIRGDELHNETSQILKLLLDAGANPNAKNKEGYPILLAAFSRQDPGLVDDLIKAGANVNATLPSGSPVTVEAAYSGNQKIMEILLKAGANINAKRVDGTTPLLVATSKQKWELCKLLIQEGADVNAQLRDGTTALMVTAHKQNQELCRLLIQKGADVNARLENGQTPLFIAVGAGDLEIVKLLTEEGADINAKDKWNNCPLSIAKKRQLQQIGDFLQQKTVDRTTTDLAWENDPEAFAKLFFRDFDKLPSSGLLTFDDVPKVASMVKGQAVEWSFKYGIDPRLQTSAESIDPGNPMLYDIATVGKDDEKVMVFLVGSRGENEAKIDQNEMTWGISPESDIIVKGSLENAFVMIAAPKFRIGLGPHAGLAIILKDLYVDTASYRCEWPQYHEEFSKSSSAFMGPVDLNLRVENSFPFAVKVGVRSGARGRDFIVPSNDTAGIFLPEGEKCDIYFQYANDPGNLYQGNSFEMKPGEITTIQLKEQIGGNYNVHKVR